MGNIVVATITYQNHLVNMETRTYVYSRTTSACGACQLTWRFIPNVSTLTLSQELFGSETAKPTQLLISHCPELIGDIASRRPADDLPHGASVGPDERGRFLTTRLKEYPLALCFAFAKCLIPQNTAVSFGGAHGVFRCRHQSVSSHACKDDWLHHRHGL